MKKINTFWNIFGCIGGLSVLYTLGLYGVVYDEIPVLHVFCVLGVIVVGIFGVWSYRQLKQAARDLKDE